MDDRPSVSAVILAGGRASRFEGDKLAADLGGQAVLDRTIEVVRPIAGEVFVVGRRSGSAGVIDVPDDEPFQGPLAGLATGLRHASGDVVLAIGGDMALANPKVLRLLLKRLGSRRGHGRRAAGPAAVLESSTALQPLPVAVWRADGLLAAEAALAAGERSLRALLDRLDIAVVPEPTWRAIDPTANTLMDVDTAADLARARDRLERPT